MKVMIDCVGSRKTDVPLLVVQGDADGALRFEKTGKRVVEFNDDVKLVVVKDGPHPIPWTHAEKVNGALLQFIDAHTPAIAG